MKIESVALDSLHVDPANVRRHPQRNLDTIRASLARFGQQRPIVVDAKGVVRAGNGTLEAARSLGWENIDVVRTPLQGSEATAYAIADNRSAEQAEWDDTGLAEVLRSLQSEDFDLDAVGFTGDEVDELCKGLGKPTDQDWADAFEQDGDTSGVDDQRQVTFVLASEDHDALMEHLKTFDANKNIAITKWLSSSGR